MRSGLFAMFYGGPDQLMPLQTAMATVLAFLLIFWNKASLLFARAWKWLRTCRGENAESREGSSRPTGGGNHR